MIQSLPLTTVAQLEARLHEQILVVCTLRLAVDMQGMRLAHSHSELRMPWHCRPWLSGFRMRAPSHRRNGRIES
jgi:hypothetical protein